MKFSTVKRVVLTSSMASVMMSGKPLTSDVVIDETWYSDQVVCENHKVCIMYACYYPSQSMTFYSLLVAIFPCQWKQDLILSP